MNAVTAVRAAAAVIGLTMSSVIVAADPASNPPATGVPFLYRSEMRDWLADGERGIWIQMRSLKWFYVRLTGHCPGLGTTNSLAFATGASNRLDRMTSVRVPEHGGCRVTQLSPSAGPAKNRTVKVALQPQSQ
jgi:hypothetical protein